MQPGNFVAHLHPQGRIQVGKRLIEQQNVRLPRHGSAHCHTLALPSRQFFWLALQQFVQLKDLRCFQHALTQAALFSLGQFETKADVVVDAHVRVQRIRLKHHADATLARLQVVDPSPVDQQVAAADRIQSGDQSQQSRLSAARRANEHHEFTRSDLQVDVAKNPRAAQLFVHVV
ncbi:hypothetical protein D3C84_441350 [compost metagenome]